MAAFFLSLRPSASVDSNTALQTTHIRFGSRTVSLTRVTPGLRMAVERLGTVGEHEDALGNAVFESDGFAALARWHDLLRRLSQSGVLMRSVHWHGHRLATLVPFPTGRFDYQGRDLDADRPYQLS